MLEAETTTCLWLAEKGADAAVGRAVLKSVGKTSMYYVGHTDGSK